MTRGIIKADEHHDATREFHPSYRLLKKFADAFRPDFVVDLGDILDLEYISTFNKADLKKLSAHDFVDDFDLVNREYDWWLERTAKFYQIQGNHDERTERVSASAPMFSSLIDYARVFDYAGRGISYTRLVDPPLKIGKLSLIHGWYTVKYHAFKTLMALGGNVAYGHMHEFQTYSHKFPATDQEIQAWCIACLNDVNPEWKKGCPTGWQNGFAVIDMADSGDFNLYPINIIGGKFYFEGREYALAEAVDTIAAKE